MARKCVECRPVSPTYVHANWLTMCGLTAYAARQVEYQVQTITRRDAHVPVTFLLSVYQRCEYSVYNKQALVVWWSHCIRCRIARRLVTVVGVSTLDSSRYGRLTPEYIHSKHCKQVELSSHIHTDGHPCSTWFDHN